MTVLVTGGSGFVGLNVLQQLLERGEEVVNFSLTPPPPAAQTLFSSLPGTLHTVEGDVCYAAAVDAVFRTHEITRVVHAAVVTAGFQREQRDAPTIVAANVLGTVNVLEAAWRHEALRVLYPSSGAVYGASGHAHPELLEDETLPQPASLYGVTKFAAERIALRYRELHGLDVLAARLGIVFGRWEHDTGHRDTLSPILQLTRMAWDGAEAVLPNPGERDWIYAPDVAAGLLALLDAPEPRHVLYHVAPGRTWSAEAWCERLAQRFPGFRYRIAADEADPGVNVNLHRATQRAPLSNRRIVEDVGFAAHFGLDEAFADYLDWRERYPL